MKQPVHRQEICRKPHVLGQVAQLIREFGWCILIGGVTRGHNSANSLLYMGKLAHEVHGRNFTVSLL
jgi:hypothetical protein